MYSTLQKMRRLEPIYALMNDAVASASPPFGDARFKLASALMTYSSPIRNCFCPAFRKKYRELICVAESAAMSGDFTAAQAAYVHMVDVCAAEALLLKAQATKLAVNGCAPLEIRGISERSLAATASASTWSIATCEVGCITLHTTAVLCAVHIITQNRVLYN